MRSGSRSLPLLLLALSLPALTLGPMGCSSSTKPRERWWQFWRPKQVAEGIYHPDRVILPPPPGLVPPMERESSVTLLPTNNLPAPPVPFNSSIDLPEPPPIREEPAGIAADMETVYFGYDSYLLNVETQASMEHNAQWVLNHPGIEIQIEGHCDERGTVEYNMLLGERRAKAVKSFLVQRGVDPDRLHTISYGEERPLEVGLSETVFSKNRRAQFLVY